MARGVIDIAGFEAKFQSDPDPWNYRTSRFEAFKRTVLLQACGDRQYGRGLELACANGETTRHIALKCLRLLALDGSAAAVAAAQSRTADVFNVTVSEAALPAQMPRGPFDLIVISELVYYLDRHDFSELLHRVDVALAPGGRLVILHHIIPFDDVAILPALAQRRAIQHFTRQHRMVFRRSLAHFDAVAFERPLRG